MTQIPDSHIDLFNRPLLLGLATVQPDGQPQVTPVWGDVEDGLIRFNTAEEALSAIENVSAHYDAHCRAAREIVHEYFDANKVLEQLLNKID